MNKKDGSCLQEACGLVDLVVDWILGSEKEGSVMKISQVSALNN